MASEYFPAKPTAGDHFMVEDLLDFSHGGACEHLAAGNTNSADSPASSSADITALDRCNSFSFSFNNNHINFPSATDFPFFGDLCVPLDDLAELEWLSNFVDEESFSSEEDLQRFHLISGTPAFKIRPEEFSQTRFNRHDPTRAVHAQTQSPELPVLGKGARSKRSRGNWASRLVLVSGPSEAAPEKAGETRKCMHCAAEKTPQWRAGPMGPKTLCNACGVRYKSGRLVAEYRPAASPTFVQTKHSNSHRKVMELRRQKELMNHQQLQQQQQQLVHDANGSMVFDPSNSDDYLTHQQTGSNFRQLI
ncbi:hypothetical protein Cgig2_013524 [Carnegiea gigantea]|uniref:GATA transcription factor n=1 Tax=Carnegiea gigantea TaxID=171969 RepID=A0A9Q1GQH5_9CARY|nr:hypothetical protein Cgig2_013524 [Carnegiea gigantea]